jgi:hypothetical protein
VKETEHDYGMMLTAYSIAINVILIIAFGFVFWHTFLRSEWNAGFVSCRNNMGLIEIAGAGDDTKQGRGK